MSCRLIQNITHSCEYNAGGITNIYLLDIRDFVSYTFSQDGLYDSCFVDKINTTTSFLEIGTVNESSFSETNENGVHKQELTTFIHTLSSDKLANILLAASNKHLVALRTSQGKMYCFGSDGGASFAFSQVTGQMGEVTGYSINISKNSVFPLFEINVDRFNTIPVLATEDSRIVSTEDKNNAILIFSNDAMKSGNDILPDQYQKGKTDTVFISIPTHSVNGSGLLGYDYDNMVLQEGRPIERTYKTIVVGEYEWTQENLIVEFANTLSWANLTQNQIETITGRNDIQPYQFRNVFGVLLGWHSQTSVYYTISKDPLDNSGVSFFRNRGVLTNEFMTDWRLPDAASILQILGQAPRENGNVFEDFNDFIYTNQNNFGLGWNLLNRRNISGLSFTPLGIRNNASNSKLEGVGETVGLQSPWLQHQHRIQNTSIGSQPKGIHTNLQSSYMTQVRYCRRLSDQELGYKLYVDDTEDKILMLDPETVVGLDELQPGLERGIALRYANRQHKQILKSWSEIKAETAAIKTSVVITN